MWLALSLGLRLVNTFDIRFIFDIRHGLFELLGREPALCSVGGTDSIALVDDATQIDLLEKVGGELAGIDRDLVEQAFLVGLLEYVLLDRVLADQPINMNLAGLADAMASVLCLCIHCWIPVTVVEYNRVGAGEVDTKTTAACRENERKDAPIGIEALHERLARLGLGGAVEAQVRVAVEVEELFECIEHLGHLRKDQNPMTYILH